MQAFFGHIGFDVEFSTPRNRDQCRVDFSDGLGDALLRLGHRHNGRGGVLLDVRLAQLGSFLLVKALGVGFDSLRVERLPGVDGQRDAFGESPISVRSPLIRPNFSSLFRVSMVRR